jgi:hypothetical protein
MIDGLPPRNSSPNPSEAKDVNPSPLILQGTQADEELNVAELLQQLENADAMANGMESRLDDNLGTLDDLLSTLEAPGHAGDPSTSSEQPSVERKNVETE